MTGRGNAEQMPPWELPANATKSGVLTRGSKGRAYGNANEIRFRRDKSGSELLSIHAELDMNRHVERDDATSIGRDQTVVSARPDPVGDAQNRSAHVEQNENLNVGLEQNQKIGTNQVCMSWPTDRSRSTAIRPRR